jgi:hypothetical protein
MFVNFFSRIKKQEEKKKKKFVGRLREVCAGYDGQAGNYYRWLRREKLLRRGARNYYRR